MPAGEKREEKKALLDQFSLMASNFLIVKSWCFAIALLSLSYGSQAQNNAISITARAMLCFNNMTIYRNCQGQYRLSPNGTLSVPSNATNFFCNGPCMAETQLVLGCVDGILSNFQFYNGATIQVVNATLLLACGNTTRRGDFNVSKNIIAAPAGGGQSSTGSRFHSSHVHIPDHVGSLSLWITIFLIAIFFVV